VLGFPGWWVEWTYVGRTKFLMGLAVILKISNDDISGTCCPINFVTSTQVVLYCHAL